jgi:hypothetical protein
MSTDAPDPPPSSPGEPAPGEGPPLVERRDRSDRRQSDRRKRQMPVELDRRRGADRRRGDRRKRSINQYDLSEEEMEFVQAVARFREETGNRFPTARDILGILRALGYEKRA